MPEISEILDSVMVPSLIKDDFIKGGVFDKTARGFRFYSGGFTVVFPVVAKGHKWAFRCWHCELGNVHRRFKIASDYINSLNSPYFCEFHYCDEGIIIEEKIFPTTRMKWVEGETLNKYILRHIGNSSALKALASSFLSMTEFLHQNKIAHGDLQHGNIIISDNGIKLVDYDSIFVPGLEGCSDIIIGKADFQHPKRRNAGLSSEKLDYFSELTIYLSILALSLQPELANDFSIEDSLLFRADDWNDFENSRIHNALSEINNDDVKLLLSILIEYLSEEDINNLRPFTERWKGLSATPIIRSFTCYAVRDIVYKGTPTAISWEIENYSRAYLNGQEIPDGVTSIDLAFDKDTTIVLTIINGLHTIEERKHIRVVELPEISLSSDKYKLKRMHGDIQSATLSWNVKNAHSVTLRCNEKTLSNRASIKSFNVKPDKDTTYHLDAIGLDGQTIFTKSITIIVRNPADIFFHSDKYFTLPGVPFTLSWNIKHAKSVRLNSSTVPLKGQSSFIIDSDSEYKLFVEDEFETKEESIKVRMLPLPVIKSLLVPAPNIDRAVGIQYNSPHFETIPKIPCIESKFANLQIPPVPDLKDSGLYINISLPDQPKLSKRISRFLKRIFNS